MSGHILSETFLLVLSTALTEQQTRPGGSGGCVFKAVCVFKRVSLWGLAQELEWKPMLLSAQGAQSLPRKLRLCHTHADGNIEKL